MGDVVRFGRFKVTDVPSSLRTLAEQIDDGSRGVRRVVVVIETAEGNSDYCAFGEDFTCYHAIGMLAVCSNDIQGLRDDD